MKLIVKTSTALFLIVLFPLLVSSQNCSTLNIQHVTDIPSTCNQLTLTMKQDNLNRPFLYVASKEGGLKIYDITSLASPLLSINIPADSFNLLDVMSISQYGDYLYLALGNSFTNPQNSGMAIVDITNPATAYVTDVYELTTGILTGGGIVKVDGNFAYFGAMQNGLIVLDVSNKNNILFVSQFVPDINYPVPNPNNPATFNARGMEIKNDIVYLCYDAGGIRIINVADKFNPVETGRFSNPALNALPRAYNNLVLDDTLLYVAVDYCGLEVLNVADTSNITLYSWWNPWTCQTNPFNWTVSPGYSNEIEYNEDCKLLFISTGRNDMRVVDISNPAQPDSCNFYGVPNDSNATWGVSIYQDRIYLGYICAPFIIPFYANTTGVKILTYDLCNAGINTPDADEIKVFPVPGNNQLTVYTNKTFSDLSKIELSVTNSLGQRQMVSHKISDSGNFQIDISSLAEGFYVLQLNGENKFYSNSFVKN